MAKVDIVQVDNGGKWDPETHYAVEEEKTAKEGANKFLI